MSEARHVVNAQLLTIFLDAPRFDQGRIYLLKVNNINTRTKCEICSKLTIKTLE